MTSLAVAPTGARTSIKAETALQPWRVSQTKTVNVPISGFLGPPVRIEVPARELARASVLGAVLVTAIPRTQGPLVDQYRVVLLGFAKGYGGVQSPPETRVETTTPLASVLSDLRERSGLPATQVAHMLGIQRRQLYYIADGGQTTSGREHRIRSLGRAIDRLYEQFDGDVAKVRSALLAPIGGDLRSFVDLATEGASIQDASATLERYLARRGGQVRPYIQTPRQARDRERVVAEVFKEIRDIAPETG